MVTQLEFTPYHTDLIIKDKGRGQLKKKRFLSGIARIRGEGGDLTMPEFFGPLSKSAFLVNKESISSKNNANVLNF